MKKRLDKKLLIPFGILLIMLLALIVTSYSYASIGFFIEENYQLTSATNYYTIGEKYYASQSITLGQTQANVSITNHIVNDSYSNNYFDLLLFLPEGVSASIGSLGNIFAINNGSVYICTGMLFDSVDNTMTLDITLENATSGVMKTVVLSHDDNNQYISSIFALKMLKNEDNHNIFNTTPFGSWMTLSSGAYSIIGNEITITNIANIIYKDESPSTNLIGYISSEADYITFSFKKIVFSSGLAIAGGNTMEFHKIDNYYYNDSYGLRLKLNEGVFSIDTLPYNTYESYKNIYFIDDITINELFTLNIPCSINLLYSTLMLNDDFVISHPYGGNFSFTNIAGSGGVINDNASLIIRTPNAYYSTAVSYGGIEGSLSSSSNFAKYSEAVNFDLEENSSLLDALIIDAESYALLQVPDMVYSNIILNKNYHNYAITYKYIVQSNAFNSSGIATRLLDTTIANLTVETYFKGNKVSEADKTLQVIGSGEDAVAKATLDFLKIYIDKASLLEESVHYLHQKIEVFALINKLITGLEINNAFKISLDEELSFSVNYYVGATLTYAKGNQIEIIPQSGSISLLINDVTVISVDIEDISTIYLKQNDIVLASKAQNIKLQYDYSGSDYQKFYQFATNVQGMTFLEKVSYIERFVETLYITDNNMALDILQLDSVDGYYKGAKESNNLVIPHNLGASSLVYKIYTVKNEIYDSFVNEEITANELIADIDTVDKTSSFNIVDGVITANKIKLDADYKLILCAEIAFDTEIVEEEDYKAIRQIIIPAGGLGESDYVEYTRGDTFAPYFNGLEKGMLINSTVTVGEEIGNAYIFAPFESGVFLEMSIENPLDVVFGGYEFCVLVKNTTSDYYQIGIDIDKIPAKNTVVSLYMRFFIGTDTTISEQTYSFIIPGIYKLGRDVTNEAIYKRMLEVYDNYDNTYLLVDGAQAVVQLFDCSLSTLDLETNEDVDLTGVEKLINTAVMKFDNVKILSLEPFAKFDSKVLVELSLNNCGITDAILYAKTGNFANLYYLNLLKKINLGSNSITKLTNAGDAFIYRSVEQLYLDNQRIGINRCLTNIENINLLVNLKTIDISNNGIAEFAPLTECKKLVSVYLADNIATEFSNKIVGDSIVYYGSSGVINKSVYVNLIDKDIVIMDIVSPFTEDERILILALNAINYLQTQHGALVVPTKAYKNITNQTYYNISVNYVLKNNSAIAYTQTPISGDSERGTITSANFVSDDIIKVIVSIDDGVNIVYRQLKFNYKEAI